MTLIGVLIANSRSQAVTDTKLEELTREVREHNNFARRVPILEEQMKVANHRIADLETKRESEELIYGTLAKDLCRHHRPHRCAAACPDQSGAERSGQTLLPIESTTVEQLVTAGITTVAALISWWNNNSFTSAAIQADAEYARLKQKSE